MKNNVVNSLTQVNILIEEILTSVRSFLVEHQIDLIREKFGIYINELYNNSFNVRDIPNQGENISIKDIYYPIKLNELEFGTEVYPEELILNDLIYGNKIFIQGDKGFGKKTILKFLCIQSIETEKYVPIKIDLNNISDSNSIFNEVRNQLRLNDLELELMLNNKKMILLIYNIEEKIGQNFNIICNEINRFINQFNLCTYIITSENTSCLKLIAFSKKFKIKQIDLEDSKQILKKYDKAFKQNFYNELEEYLNIYQKGFEELLKSPLYISSVYSAYFYLKRINIKKDKELILYFKKILEKLLSKQVENKIKSRFKHELLYDRYSDDEIKFHKPTYIAMKDDLVIHPPFGHLGVTLWFSHIPRIAKESKRYNRVLISNRAEYNNLEYKYLCWELNPYVDGYCDDTNYKSYDECGKYINSYNTVLDSIMLMYNMDDKQQGHSPEIFYKPKLIDELKDKTLYDPNCISLTHFDVKDYFLIDKYFKKQSIILDYQMRVRIENPNNYLDSHRRIPVSVFNEIIRTRTLRDFCDVLYSVKNIYSLLTGTEALAPSINKYVTVLTGEEVNVRSSQKNVFINLSKFDFE